METNANTRLLCQENGNGINTKYVSCKTIKIYFLPYFTYDQIRILPPFCRFDGTVFHILISFCYEDKVGTS